MGRKRVDLSGMKIGKLRVVKQVKRPFSKRDVSYFLCKCDCGNETIVRGDNLQQYHTQSCGCLHISGKAVKRITPERLLRENRVGKI